MSSKCILLIDDEIDILKIAQAGLMMAAEWQLLTAQSSLDGIEIAHAHQPDAILLDVMMPEVDGVMALKMLKESPKTAHIPVIFLTAKAQSADRRGFYSLGAQGVITKPFDPMTLASQISGFLGWTA